MIARAEVSISIDQRLKKKEPFYSQCSLGEIFYFGKLKGQKLIKLGFKVTI